MVLRFQIPLNAWVVGPSEQALYLGSTFTYRRCRIIATLRGDGHASHLDNLPSDSSYFRRNVSLNFMVLPEPPADALLKGMLQNKDWPGVLKFISTAGNYVLRAIRNHGAVPHVSEIRTNLVKPEEELLRWRAEWSDDATTWHSVAPEPEGLEGIGAYAWPEVGPEIRASRWPQIEIAIEHNIPARPEQEFTTNALEFVRLGNSRMAVAESIIGLEIVLNHFLIKSLIARKIGEKEANTFISPQLGLTDRISVVLPLVAPEVGDVIDLKKVRLVVTWRNKVIHQTGNLPEGLTDAVVRDGVSEVAALTYHLAMLLQQIEATPQLRELVQDISATFNIPIPALHIGPDHGLAGVVQLGPSKDRNTMLKILENIEGRWMKVDKQFQWDRSTIVFVDASGLVTRWQKGQFAEGKPGEKGTA